MKTSRHTTLLAVAALLALAFTVSFQPARVHAQRPGELEFMADGPEAGFVTDPSVKDLKYLPPPPKNFPRTDAEWRDFGKNVLKQAADTVESDLDKARYVSTRVCEILADCGVKPNTGWYGRGRSLASFGEQGIGSCGWLACVLSAAFDGAGINSPVFPMQAALPTHEEMYGTGVLDGPANLDLNRNHGAVAIYSGGGEAAVFDPWSYGYGTGSFAGFGMSDSWNGVSIAGWSHRMMKDNGYTRFCAGDGSSQKYYLDALNEWNDLRVSDAGANFLVKIKKALLDGNAEKARGILDGIADSEVKAYVRGRLTGPQATAIDGVPASSAGTPTEKTVGENVIPGSGGPGEDKGADAPGKGAHRSDAELLKGLKCGLARDVKRGRDGRVKTANRFVVTTGDLKISDFPWVVPGGALYDPGLLKTLYAPFREAPIFRMRALYPGKKEADTREGRFGWTSMAFERDDSFRSVLAKLAREREDLGADLAKREGRLSRIPEEKARDLKAGASGFASLRQKALKGIDQEEKLLQLKRQYHDVRVKSGVSGSFSFPCRDEEGKPTTGLAEWHDDFTPIHGDPLSSPMDKEEFDAAMARLKRYRQGIQSYDWDAGEIGKRYDLLEKQTKALIGKLKAAIKANEEASRAERARAAEAARMAAEAFRASRKESDVQKSLNFAYSTDDPALLRGNLLNFRADFDYRLSYVVTVFPGYGQWRQKIDSPRALLELLGRTWPMDSKTDTLVVELLIGPEESSHYSFSIKLMSDEYEKGVAAEDGLWKRDSGGLVKKCSSFVKGFRGDPGMAAKFLSPLKTLVKLGPGAEAEKFYACLGLTDAFRQSLDRTRKLLARCDPKVMDEVDHTWKELFSMAEARVEELMNSAEKTDSGPKNGSLLADSVTGSEGRAGPAKGSGGLFDGPFESGVRTSGTNPAESTPARTSGLDPAIALAALLDRIDAHARNALTAMDFKQDCGARVARHMESITGELREMEKILKKLRPSRDLPSKLLGKLRDWAAKNAKSQAALEQQAGKVAQTPVPAVPAGLTIAKYRQRTEAQRSKIVNMKKCYSAISPVVNKNLALARSIENLLVR